MILCGWENDYRSCPNIITFGLEYRNERWATVLSCIFSFSRSRDILGGIKFWNGSHDPNNASFWDDFSSAGWDLLTSTYTPNLMSLSAPVTKIWKAVQNVEIGGSLGHLGSLKVIGNVTIRYSAYDFLFDFNRNHASILYRFRDIAGYLLKVDDFDPPHLHSAPP